MGDPTRRGLSPLSPSEHKPPLLIAPGEGAEELVASLAELDTAPRAADPVAEGDGPDAIAAALASYERQAERLAPAAAVVHGTGDRPLAAMISLVKLGVPVARVGGSDGLTELLADHTISPGAALQGQVRAWLRRILTP